MRGLATPLHAAMDLEVVELPAAVALLHAQPKASAPRFWPEMGPSDAPVPRPTQSMPELMSVRGNGPGLRVGCTFKASGPETASKDLCARAARLLSEAFEPTEIVLGDAAKWLLGLRIPCVLQGFHRSPKTHLL